MKLQILNFSFISRSASGKIFYLMVLGLYAHELCKNAKNRIVISFLSQTLCKTAVPLERHDELGHTETCYDVRSLFAYCSNKVSFCICNQLMSSQVYEHANLSYFASSSHQLKIFDFLDRFNRVTLKKIYYF